MRLRSLALLFWALTTFAQVAGQPAADPYQGALHKNSYSNPYFGFSFEMPPGFKVSIGTEEQRKTAQFLVTGWLKAHPSPDDIIFSVSEDPKTHERRSRVAVLRTGGFLIVATPDKPWESSSGTRRKARTVEESTAQYGGRSLQLDHSYEKTRKGKKDLASIFLLQEKGYYLRFIFIAEDEKTFGQLLQIMETLKFDTSPAN